MSNDQNRPEFVLRDGRLKATVWRNTNQEGKEFYSTTFAKTITGQDGNPRDVQSFSQTELLRISELGRETYSAINDVKRERAHSQSQNHQNAQSFDDRQSFKEQRRDTVQAQAHRQAR